MFPTDRRSVLRVLLWGSAAFLPSHSARALTNSLSDLGGTMVQNADAVIYTAREVVTLDPARPTAQAVAVLGDRIHAAGTLSEVTAALDGLPYRVDDRYSGHVIVPGFIAQHDHPILAALTMASVILSIEDWVLPGGTVPAVRDKADFIARLTEAVSAAPTADEPILTWGYHPSFYGRLTRSDLDAISTEQPILAWARSCHEMVLNSAALARGGVTADTVAGFFRHRAGTVELRRGPVLGTGVFCGFAEHRQHGRLARAAARGIGTVARLHARQGHNHRQ